MEESKENNDVRNDEERPEVNEDQPKGVGVDLASGTDTETEATPPVGSGRVEHFKSEADASSTSIVIHITPMSDDGRKWLEEWTPEHRNEVAAHQGANVADALTALIEEQKREESNG